MRSVLFALGLAVLLSGCVLVMHGLPALVISAKPRLVVVADTDLYYAPDVDEDVFFYGNLWYRCYGSHWYRAEAHTGPWLAIQVLPPVFYRIPPGHAKYRCVPMHRLPPGRRYGRRRW